MKSNVETPTPPQHVASYLSFSSLPEDIVLSCFARIPTLYYPKLSLVSKSFRSLIISNDLAKARYELKTKEKCVVLFLKLATRDHLFWFSLYRTKNTGNLLVPVPSSYIPYLPMLQIFTGSEFYMFDGRTAPSCVFFVSKTLKNRKWPKTPSMKVARMNTLVMKDLNEKIYVMGGCDPNESTHWAEVFDIKTQTWESLPDPGHELRLSLLKRLWCYEGKLYVRTDKKHYVYDPEQGSWDVTEIWLSDCICHIDNVMYRCYEKRCNWFDSKHQVWEEVKGLDMLDTYDKNGCIEMTDFGGQLIMFCESPNEGIWCAMITLERRESEVWGEIESVDKLNVPDSSILIRSVVATI